MNEQPQTSDSISCIHLDGRQIHLVGTAHVSPESVEDVRETINTVQPDTIAVELCQPRYEAMTNKDAWRNMNIFKVLREKKAVFLLAQLLMSSFYKRLGEKLGVQPGAEMLTAAQMANERGATLVMADRKIEITLKRLWGYLGFWTKLKLFVHMIASIFVGEEIDAEMIEQIKHKDQLEAVMAEFSEKFPEIKRRLIDERDIYLAQKIRQSPGKRVVAVVGKGHVEGIKQHIQKDINLTELEVIPPKSIWPKIFKWAIPTAILALIIYGFYKEGAAHAVENVYIWILVNGILSAVGAAVALGHPLTIVSAFFAAPLTSINPFMAAGWVAGLVQAWIRTPKVDDFEALPKTTASLKAFWVNPVTKILLVTALANLGSVLGTYIAASWIATRTL